LVHFLCLPKENGTKRKAPLHARPSGSLPGCGGSPTGHPWPDDELADVLSATLAGLILHPSAAPEGEGEQREALPASRTSKTPVTPQNSRACRHVAIYRLTLSSLPPLSPREAVE